MAPQASGKPLTYCSPSCVLRGTSTPRESFCAATVLSSRSLDGQRRLDRAGARPSRRSAGASVMYVPGERRPADERPRSSGTESTTSTVPSASAVAASDGFTSTSTTLQPELARRAPRRRRRRCRPVLPVVRAGERRVRQVDAGAAGSPASLIAGGATCGRAACGCGVVAARDSDRRDRPRHDDQRATSGASVSARTMRHAVVPFRDRRRVLPPG